MPNKLPFVSVIVPNYNHAPYLEQRLESILNQTYQNFEVIILDDCSTDNSMEVIRRYKDNPHVSQIINNDKNSGKVFKQWNKGFNLAKGDVIWIAESDDFCELNMLQLLIDAYLKKKNTVLAYAPTVFVDADGKITGAYSIEGRTQFFRGDDFIKKYLTINNGIFNASCAIFSRNAALNANPDYMTYKGIGDWWFWMYIAQQGNVAIVNKHLNYFRQHGSNTTAKLTFDGTNIKDIKILLDYIYTHYHIPVWKRKYINKMHRDCYSKIKFIDEAVTLEISRLWHLEYRSSLFEKVYCRVLSSLQRNYLLRL